MCDVEGSRIMKQETKTSGCCGVRYLQYILYFVVLNIAYGIRSILSVGIYAMISEKPPSEDIPTYPEWSSMKNIMLSSFFWGYICFQVGAGQLAKNYGPKLFLGGTTFLGSVFCLLIPVFGCYFGSTGVIVCRVITGMTQGFIFPCVHTLLSSWAPLHDRAKISTFAYAGGPLGTVISMPVTGLISDSIGWPVVFYLYGGLGMAWSVIWFLVGSDSPAKHSSISDEERKYIEAELQNEDKESIPTPWKAIFTSLPFWAILITHCGQNWGFWTLFTEIPSYMKNILKFDIKSNSTLSALPYLFLWLLSLVLSPIADYLIVRNYKIGASRKIFNSIGLYSPALALILMSFVDNDQTTLTIALLVLGVGFNAAIFCGYHINHMDLSPVHAGTLMGITNCVANIFSLLGPLAVDLIKAISGYSETDKALWTITFCIAAGVFILVATFYNFAASGEVQPWNHIEDKKQNKTSEKIV